MDTVRQMAGDMPWVEVCGARSQSDVYDLMGQARALLFSSLMTSYPRTLARVVMEAYAKGTPVVASDTCSAGELILQARTGLVFRVGDVNSLADQVQWIWEHEEEAAEMGRNARQQYELDYTAERNYRLLMEIYERAIHQRKRGLAAQQL